MIAVSPGRSPDVLVVMAHRDNRGTTGQVRMTMPPAQASSWSSPAATACERRPPDSPRTGRPTHTIVLVSSDGGAYGGLGAVRFLETSPYRRRISAAVNLVAIGGDDSVRIEIAADRPRSPDATLVETAAARIVQRTGREPRRTSAAGQLIDLAFPFSFYEQAPLIGAAVPALSLTTAGLRRPTRDGHTRHAERPTHRPDRPGIGGAPRLARRGRGPGPRHVDVPLPGGTNGPGLGSAARPDHGAPAFPARCRRPLRPLQARRIPLAPALRSYRTRLAFWLWVGLVFGFLAMVGAWPQVELPPPPGTSPAGDWPVVTLTIFMVFVFASWLIGRERCCRGGGLAGGGAGRPDDCAARPRRAGASDPRHERVRADLPSPVAPRLAVARRCVPALPGCARRARFGLPRAGHPAGGRSRGGSSSVSTRRGTCSTRRDRLRAAAADRDRARLVRGRRAARRDRNGTLRAVPDVRERPPRGPIRQLVGRLLGLALGRKPTELKRAVGS